MGKYFFVLYSSQNYIKDNLFLYSNTLRAAGDLEVYAGQSKLNTTGNLSKRFDVSSVVVHENYNHTVSFANDIAILNLQSPTYNQNEYVKFITLPTQSPQNQDLDYACMLSGWGQYQQVNMLLMHHHNIIF